MKTKEDIMEYLKQKKGNHSNIDDLFLLNEIIICSFKNKLNDYGLYFYKFGNNNCKFDLFLLDDCEGYRINKMFGIIQYSEIPDFVDSILHMD